MEQLNLDPNGELNYSEFIAATLDKKQYLNPDSLWAAMKYFDIDNRNFITNKNLRDALVGFLILIIIILIIINEKSQKKKNTHKKARSGRKYANQELDLWIRQIDQFTDMMKNVVLKKTVEFEEKPLK